jgi:hypothetical protein
VLLLLDALPFRPQARIIIIAVIIIEETDSQYDFARKQCRRKRLICQVDVHFVIREAAKNGQSPYTSCGYCLPSSELALL